VRIFVGKGRKRKKRKRRRTKKNKGPSNLRSCEKKEERRGKGKESGASSLYLKNALLTFCCKGRGEKRKERETSFLRGEKKTKKKGEERTRNKDSRKLLLFATERKKGRGEKKPLSVMALRCRSSLKKKKILARF